MTQKPFERLTDTQKSKVQLRLNEAYKYIIGTIDFLEFTDNEDKKANIFINAVDIHMRSVSNIIVKDSFSCNLKSMFILSMKENYLSSKI